MIGIYGYLDLEKCKFDYIGQSNDLIYRHKQHLLKSRYNNQQINRVLQNNPDRYVFQVLEECSIEELDDLEIQYIKIHNPRFNFTEGGGGMRGNIPSDDTKRKISNSLKGMNHSIEAMKNMSKSKNNSGYFRVGFDKNDNVYRYRYYENGKHKKISSVDIKKLEIKVKKRGLEWHKF